MDFTFTPEQDEAAELAAKILGDRATNERMKAVEADGSRFDRDLWAELGSAGLLGLALPEEYDGAGLGLVELCRVLVEVGPHGRAGARWPPTARRRGCWPSTAATTQKQQWLPGAATGGQRAHRGGGRGARVRARAADDPAAADGDGYRLTGSKAIVPAGPYADAVPRAGRDAVRGRASSWSSPATPGVTVTAQTFSDGDAVARVDLDGVALGADRLVGPADGSVDRRAAPAAAAGRLRRAARHLRGRARADRVVRQDPRAVRPPDRHLPGGLAAAGRRLHRHPRAAAHALAGRLAARRGAAGRHRGRDRQAVGRRRRPPDRAHHRARARRRRDRPRRRGAPLLHLGQALRVPARRRHRAGAAHRADPRGRARLTWPDGRDRSAAPAGARRGRPRRPASTATAPGPGASTSPRPPPRRRRVIALADPDRPLHVGVLLGNTPEMLRVDGRGGAGRLRAGAGSTPPAAATALLADVRRSDCQLLLVNDEHAARCSTGSTSPASASST